MTEGTAAPTATTAGFSYGVDIDKPTPPAPQQQQSEAATKFLQSVPEAYSQKEWVSNFAKTADPWGELAKAYDNQMSLVGRKAEGLRVPGDNATPEEWSAFHKAIGVPESADKYEYKAPEVPENLKQYFAQDDQLLSAMREAGMKAGLTPKGFQIMAEAFDKYYMGELQKSVENVNSTLSALENGFKQKFGDKSNQVLDTWNGSVNSLLSKEQAAVLQGLDPSVKVILAEQYEAFAKKYIREDRLDLGVPRASQHMTSAEYGDEYARIFAKQRAAAPGSPEYFQAQQEMKQLKEKGAQIFSK